MQEGKGGVVDDKQGAVLEHFKRGGELTVLTCWRQYGTTEMRRIVSRLRQLGYPIEGKKLNGDIYKTYRLAATVDANGQGRLVL